MKFNLILTRAFVAFSVIAMLLILGGMVTGSLLTALLGVVFLLACFACGLLGFGRELAAHNV